eukprot:600373-Pleurochrysis_carterae.AAC.1
MEAYSVSQPLSSKSKHAPGSWYAARTEALRRYSIKHFGLKEQDPDGVEKQGFAATEPRSWFRLKERPDHSNYA